MSRTVLQAFDQLGAVMPRRSLLAVAILWLPLLAAAAHWWVGAELLAVEQQRSRQIDLLQRLDDLERTGQAVPARQLLLQARQFEFQIADLLPDLAAHFSRQLDSLERALPQAEAANGARRATLVHLDNLRDQLLARNATAAAAGRQLTGQLLSLIAVLTLIGLCVVSLTFRRRSAMPAGALAGFLRDTDALLFEQAPVAIAITDLEDRILAVNPAYTRMTGYPLEEVLGQTLYFNHSEGQMGEQRDAMQQALAADGCWSGEFWMRHKGGEVFVDKVNRQPVVSRDGESFGYLTMSTDVSATDKARRLMLWQAHHDPLTKLPNRNLLQERLSRALLRPELTGAVLSIDLDRFKSVNDSAGPANGDQVLMDTAIRLAMCVPESETLARIGGDQFVMMLEHIEGYEEAERIARMVVAQMRQPFHLGDRELYITVSVGVVLFPRDGTEIGELLQKADAARNQVKEQGGDGVAFFEPEMNDRAARRFELETALRKAVENDELRLLYQPIVDVNRMTVSGGEALLRWQHPELGTVSPADFIPVAEESGLITDIGRWVVVEAQRQLDSWSQQGYPAVRLSINVSPLQIRRMEDADRLLDLIRPEFSHRLTLELTESAIVDHGESARRFLSRARRLGCRVALDDFGTGYSSLAYLREYEFDVLKIDRRFIMAMDDTRDYGLVASIVSMSKILGMKVVAEGVETTEQLHCLERVGCDFVQGFLFAKPLPAAEFRQFLGNGVLRRAG